MNYKELTLCVLIWISAQIKITLAHCGGLRSLYYEQSLEVTNDEYPLFYSPQTSCLWEIESPFDAQLNVACDEINMPTVDYLYFYTTGRKQETLVYKSGVSVWHYMWPSNKLSIELPYTYGSGKFRCFIQVLRGAAPPTTLPTPPPTTPPTTLPTPPPTTQPPQQSCDCGWRYQTRIVGGVETGVNEFPFMVGFVNKYAYFDIFCGGVIISRHYVLTAAHCDTLNLAQAYIYVGGHNVYNIYQSPYARFYDVGSVIKHPGYNSITFENDIAIVGTTEPIQFSLGVGPICLPFNFNQPDGFFSVLALGWGTTEFSGPKSDYLKKVSLQSVTNAECRLTMTEHPIYDSQMCVYSYYGDTCQADSGGPLIYLDTRVNRYSLVGMVSYGTACGSTNPSVNTRVTSFADFIMMYTGFNNGENFCVM